MFGRAGGALISGGAIGVLVFLLTPGARHWRSAPRWSRLCPGAAARRVGGGLELAAALAVALGRSGGGGFGGGGGGGGFSGGGGGFGGGGASGRW